jgi:hypothetical protein
MTLVQKMTACALLVVFSLLLMETVHAQSARLLSMDDPAYHAIKQLQQRGFLLQLHPTAMPYSEQEVAKALNRVTATDLTEAEQRWIQLLRELVTGPTTDDESDALIGGASLSAGMRAANSERLNTLRYLDGSTLAPNAAASAWLSYKNWVGQGHLQFDRYYDTDPDGIDVVRRLYVRSEEAYLGYQHKYAQFYFGRFRQQWSLVDQPGVLLTDNPRAFDQFTLKLGTDKIALRSTIGELDMLGPNGSFLERDRFKEGGKRRWLATHRLDWRPNNHWAFTLMEGVLYSGTNAGLSLNYANPLHVLGFVSDNDPKNYENNLVLGAMIWGYQQGWTFSAQMMIDDFVYSNRNEMSAQGYLEPLSTSIMASVYKTGLLEGFGFGAQAELVSSQVYHTDQAEGQWSYAQRGLATNFSDYIHLKFYADYQADRWLPGLELTPALEMLWQGEQDLRLPLQNYSVDFVLIGQPEITFRPSITARYQTDPRWWAELDAGFNFIQHQNHQENVSAVEPVVQLSVKARLLGRWILQ